ncbi:MAG: sarcosine oxidase subunit alpha family protein [Hyphomicrobiales bacterium]
MTSFRLPAGGLIDRSQALNFTFDGKAFTGHPGDTLASALMGAGVTLMGRSFKYHRPRGPVTAGSSEPNALMEIGEGARVDPNTRATMVELYEGLVARSQNRWPSLDFDLGAVNSLGAAFFAAGFYYKTFMWPKSFWEKIYEPIIRRAAGLGRASHEPDPDRYEKAYLNCDVLVIGSGPSGLMAALAAARSGARVVVCDEHAMLGGSLLTEREEIDNGDGVAFATEVLAELSTYPDVTLMPRTTVFGWYDGNVFGALERVNKHVAVVPEHEPVERYWRIVARQAILAAGAEERPLVFGGNDRPGVMQAQAVRTWVNRFAVSPGKSAVVFTNNSSGYRTARDLEAAGIHVEAVFDSRADAPKTDAGGAAVVTGAKLTDVQGGKKGVSGVSFTRGSGEEHAHADFVAMSGGWSPIVHLACHKGGKPQWDQKLAAFVPPRNTPGIEAVGSAAGIFPLSAVLESGAAAGVTAATTLGFRAKTPSIPKVRDDAPYAVTPLWWVKESTGKAFLDYQNDVTAKDIPLAAREGYSDVELAKRYTTNGMATDQGKLSNINAIGILAEATGKTPAEVGTTTFRPFYTPVTFGAFVGPLRGKHFQPVRKTPLHAWCEENGAVFMEAGQWLRSAWFPKAGEDWRASADREVRAVRGSVGICDVSTLGKIDVQGPDAGILLDRLYTNTFSTLPVGKARYGLMLREDGFLFDDGTTSRLADDHYFMTTTTANAGRVMSHIEFCHQALWPELDVQYVSVTEQWAQMAVAGPNARRVLEQVIAEDISDASLPYIGVLPVTVIGGVKGRLFRISFSGELAYELSVPADYGSAVARAIQHAGQPFGIVPYGVEALSMMRVEKGHVAGGELNGMTTPADLGLGKMVSTKKDFIGRMMGLREGMVDRNRQVLVGLQPLDPSDRFRAGSHILKVGDTPSLAADQGYVTSSSWSPMLDSWIGLALIERGRERIGEVVVCYDGLRNVNVRARITDTCFFDREHKRLHG